MLLNGTSITSICHGKDKGVGMHLQPLLSFKQCGCAEPQNLGQLLYNPGLGLAMCVSSSQRAVIPPQWDTDLSTSLCCSSVVLNNPAQNFNVLPREHVPCWEP